MFLLIDNYDSFTYNLVHYFEELGVDVEVRRNDSITTKEVHRCVCFHLGIVRIGKRLQHSSIPSLGVMLRTQKGHGAAARECANRRA